MNDFETQKQLMQRAGRLLARRSYSRGELAAKLAGRATEEDVCRTLDRLQDLDLLNDAEYAYNFAANHMKQDGWGPLKVYHSLLRRQIAPATADEAISRVHGEVSDALVLNQYLDRYCAKGGMPSDRKGIQRLVAHLRRRGFQMQIIRQALSGRISGTAWRYFDTGE